MASLLPRFAPLLLLLAAAADGQELPKRDGAKELDFLEPKLMLNDVGELPQPPGSKLGAEASQPLPLDVAKLTAELERAKKNAGWRERLWKAGVLAKVEAEQAALKVVRLTKDLEVARAEAARVALEELRQKGAPREEITAAEKNTEALTAAAKDTVAKWEAAQRAAAELRLQRERKLYALGAGSRSQVRKAEAALQTLAPRPTP